MYNNLPYDKECNCPHCKYHNNNYPWPKDALGNPIYPIQDEI